METFTKKEKEKIIILLKDKIPLGISINDSIDLQLDNDNYQACSVNNDKFKILYLLVLRDKQTRIHEERVGRLCKKHDFQYGYYVMCNRDKKGIVDISVSAEINRLK